MNMEQSIDFLYSIEKTGPSAERFSAVSHAFQILDDSGVRLSDVPDMEKECLQSFTSLKSMHGHVCQKPHGYHGDYEIIDRIYQNYHSDEYYQWDEYFQNGSASHAVRGRKDYFLSTMQNTIEERSSTEILNLSLIHI